MIRIADLDRAIRLADAAKLLPIDPAAERMVAELLARNRPAATTKRLLGKRQT